MSQLARRSRARGQRIMRIVAIFVSLAVAVVSHTAWAATTRVVVANSGDNTITIFDFNSGASLTLSDPSFSAPRGVAITDDGRFAAVTNSGADTVSWIDLTVDPPVVLGTTTVGVNPKGIAIKATLAVVAVDDPSPSNSDSIAVIDISGLPTVPGVAETTAVSLLGDTDPEGIAITPDGVYALIVQNASQDVAYVQLPGAPTLLVGTTSVGAGAFAAAVTPDQTRALVTNSGNGTLSVIDITGLPTIPTAPQVSTIVIGDTPRGLAVTSDGSNAVVGEAGTADDARIFSVPAHTSFTGPVGDDPFGVATSITPSGFRAAVANEVDGTVSVVNVSDASVALTVTVGAAPQGLAITPVHPPTANLKADPRTGKAPLTVSFDARTSTDPDGSIVSYHLDFGDGNSATNATGLFSHGYSTPGHYIAVLTVTDDDGATGSAQQGIDVAANKPPVATLKASPIKGKAPLLVTFDASGSSDVDGTVVSYQFTFGDGGSLTTSDPRPTHTYAVGTFKACVIAVDDNGASSAPACVTVQGVANKPPTASFNRSQVQPYSTHTMKFTDLSKDADGQIVAWSWSFGDGGTSTERNPTHTYAKAGTFSVTLTVTDNDGATGKKTASVGVK